MHIHSRMEISTIRETRSLSIMSNLLKSFDYHSSMVSRGLRKRLIMPLGQPTRTNFPVWPITAKEIFEEKNILRQSLLKQLWKGGNLRGSRRLL